MSNVPANLHPLSMAIDFTESIGHQACVSEDKTLEKLQQSKITQREPENYSLPETSERWCSLIADWPRFLNFWGPKWCGYVPRDKIREILSWSQPGSVIISAPTESSTGVICAVTVKINNRYTVMFDVITWRGVYITNCTKLSLTEYRSLEGILLHMMEQIRICLNTEPIFLQPDCMTYGDPITVLVHKLVELREVLQERQMWWGSLMLDEHSNDIMILTRYLLTQTVPHGNTAGLLVHVICYDFPGYLFHVLAPGKLDLIVSFASSGFQVLRGLTERPLLDTKELLDYISEEHRVTLVPKDQETMATLHSESRSLKREIGEDVPPNHSSHIKKRKILSHIRDLSGV